MDQTNRFKTSLSEKRDAPLLGSWLVSGAPSTAEALGHAGFDFLVIDMEHTPIETPDLAGMLRAIGCTPAEPVVRLPWNDRVMIKRALDAGAPTLLLPFVETAEEARAAAASTHYPPQGNRGFAVVHRASHYGQLTGYHAAANRNVCTMVQIETPGAVERLPEIAAVDGIDALFVGPGDLSANMGHLGEIGHPEVQAMLARAAADAARAGKPVGIIGPNPEMVARIAAALGGITVLVNNAARDDRQKLDEVEPDTWREMLAVNLDHQFFATQAARPILEAAGGGSIIMMGSISWMRARPGMVTYTTAKAAINGLTRTLAREFGPAGIRVNCIVPGAIVTERQLRLWATPGSNERILDQQALKFRLEPVHVARMALFLASDESAGITGANFHVDAGLALN